MRQYELWIHDYPRDYGVTVSMLGDFEKETLKPRRLCG